MELSAEYGLRGNAQFSLRLPYDIKAMHVRYTTLTGEPYIPPYGDIHHRTETLTGVSDAAAGIDWSPHTGWMLGIGTTLPIGHIVSDPIVLGREGKTHEHIQFGSGTFQPRLSVQWMHQVEKAALFARLDARLSSYENRNGYRAPNTFSWAAGPSFQAGIISINPQLNGQYQTLGRWSGVVDEGSGFENGGFRLQISAPYRGVLIAPSAYRELWSHGFDAQSFRQKTTWGVTLMKVF